MPILRDPSIHEPSAVANSWYQHDTTKNPPTSSTMDEEPGDTSFSRMHSTVDIDVLHRAFTFVSGHTEGIEIEPLPGFTHRMTANTFLEKPNTGRAERAVTVIDQNRSRDWRRSRRVQVPGSVHDPSLPVGQRFVRSRSVAISNGLNSTPTCGSAPSGAPMGSSSTGSSSPSAE